MWRCPAGCRGHGRPPSEKDDVGLGVLPARLVMKPSPHRAHIVCIQAAQGRGVLKELRGRPPARRARRPRGQQAVPALAMSARHVWSRGAPGDEQWATSGPGPYPRSAGHRRLPATAERKGHRCDLASVPARSSRDHAQAPTRPWQSDQRIRASRRKPKFRTCGRVLTPPAGRYIPFSITIRTDYAGLWPNTGLATPLPT